MQGNPSVLKQTGWTLDKGFIADKVDEYNAAICQKMGWTEFIEEGGGFVPTPFHGGRVSKLPRHSSLARSVLNVAAGASTIAEMFGASGPVEKSLAEARAGCCLSCPKHREKTNLLDFFTAPAAAAIRKMLAMVKDMDLTTSQDEKLDFCSACDCPMKLKVWAQRDHVLAHIPQESKEDLWEKCWIRKE